MKYKDCHSISYTERIKKEFPNCEEICGKCEFNKERDDSSDLISIKI